MKSFVTSRQARDHDEVKADFRQLLTTEFDVPLADVRFEQRIEVKSRTDALIGRTVFEAKRDLTREWDDVERKMPDYLANREAETGEPFVGIASDGRLWRVLALDQGKLVRIKETNLNPDKPDEFIAWLDGALALKSPCRLIQQRCGSSSAATWSPFKRRKGRCGAFGTS